MINKLKDKFINFCRWVWSECKDVKTFLLLLVVIAVVYSPVWGRVPAFGDIRLDMGVGHGIDLPCVLGRTVHALFPDLHRHNPGDKTLVGTAEE